MTVTTQKISTIINGLEPERIPVAEDGSTGCDLTPNIILNVPIENISIMANAKCVNGNGMVYIGSLYSGKHVKAVIFEDCSNGPI